MVKEVCFMESPSLKVWGNMHAYKQTLFLIFKDRENGASF